MGAALVGTYVLGLVTVLAAATPAAVWGSAPPRHGALRWLPIWLLVLLPAGHWLAGEIRLQAVPTPGDQGLRLRVVQGNVPQALKWQPRSEEHTSELQSLMRSSYAGFCLKKNK